MTVWHSRSPDDTRTLARGLAASVACEGAVVSLVGPLGAGKTEFAKGLAEGFGLDAAALASPSFTIASELPLTGPSATRLAADAPRRLIHADWFRVESVAELEASGLDDWLARDAVLVVEWGDRFAEALGADALDVRLEEVAPGEREVTASARGPTSEALLARWRERCAPGGAG